MGNMRLSYLLSFPKWRNIKVFICQVCTFMNAYFALLKPFVEILFQSKNGAKKRSE